MSTRPSRGDLRISLEHDGREVVLVHGRGGSGNHFFGTTFDDASPTSIVTANAPFTGTFQPEEPLERFAGASPAGAWILKVNDEAFLDGGSLNRWGHDGHDPRVDLRGGRRPPGRDHRGRPALHPRAHERM